MNELTTVDHWDDTWSGDLRLRLPSSLVVATRNFQRLLRTRVHPGDRVLEIGCAPGKLLAWIAAELRADVSGLDYSERGLANARHLFNALRLAADLRCEDLRQTTFPPGTFDVVFSFGLIEHFLDPRDVVQHHLKLLKPGGTAVITVPNYRGIYGTLQRYFNPDPLIYHNLEIMTCEALAALVPRGDRFQVRTYPSGRFSPSMISYKKRWHASVAFGVSLFANAIALVQPFDIPALSPMLVLEAVRSKSG